MKLAKKDATLGSCICRLVSRSTGNFIEINDLYCFSFEISQAKLLITWLTYFVGPLELRALNSSLKQF